MPENDDFSWHLIFEHSMSVEMLGHQQLVHLQCAINKRFATKVQTRLHTRTKFSDPRCVQRCRGIVS